MTAMSDAHNGKAAKPPYVSKGFYVRSSSKGANFTSSVIDARVEECKE